MNTTLKTDCQKHLDSMRKRLKLEASWCTEEFWTHVEFLERTTSDPDSDCDESIFGELRAIRKDLEDCGVKDLDSALEYVQGDVLEVTFGAGEVTGDSWPPERPDSATIVLTVGGPDIRLRCRIGNSGEPESHRLEVRWAGEKAIWDDVDGELDAYVQIILGGCVPGIDC